MSFKDYLNESPVGVVGRTGINDAYTYIKDADVNISNELLRDFARIVKKIGGKTVTKIILNKYNVGRFENLANCMQESKKLSPLQQEYREYFIDMLKKYKAESPGEMDDETTAAFFNEIADGWVVGKGKK
jgi:alpha-glucuronidase